MTNRPVDFSSSRCEALPQTSGVGLDETDWVDKHNQWACLGSCECQRKQEAESRKQSRRKETCNEEVLTDISERLPQVYNI